MAWSPPVSFRYPLASMPYDYPKLGTRQAALRAAAHVSAPSPSLWRTLPVILAWSCRFKPMLERSTAVDREREAVSPSPRACSVERCRPLLTPLEVGQC